MSLTSANSSASNIMSQELTERGCHMSEGILELEVLIEQEPTDDSRVWQRVSVNRFGSWRVQFVIICRLLISLIIRYIFTLQLNSRLQL